MESYLSDQVGGANLVLLSIYGEYLALKKRVQWRLWIHINLRREDEENKREEREET